MDSHFILGHKMTFSQGQVMYGVQNIGFTTSIRPIDQIEPWIEIYAAKIIVFKIGQYESGKYDMDWKLFL